MSDTLLPKTQWCMMPLSVTGALKTWLQQRPEHLTGNTMDAVNIQLVITPPDDIQHSAERIITLPNDADVSDLVLIIGQHLARGGNTLILGTPAQFSAAYRTPHWRLWCATNNAVYPSDHDPQFLADCAALQLPDTTTRSHARQHIYQHFSGTRT